MIKKILKFLKNNRVTGLSWIGVSWENDSKKRINRVLDAYSQIDPSQDEYGINGFIRSGALELKNNEEILDTRRKIMNCALADPFDPQILNFLKEDDALCFIAWFANTKQKNPYNPDMSKYLVDEYYKTKS